MIRLGGRKVTRKNLPRIPLCLNFRYFYKLPTTSRLALSSHAIVNLLYIRSVQSCLSLNDRVLPSVFRQSVCLNPESIPSGSI